MIFRTGLAGFALVGATFLWGTSALSQPAAPPLAAANPAVPPTPLAAAVPAADPDEGLEAREAAAPLAPATPVVDAVPGTLNAQYAALLANPAIAAPEPEPPPPTAAPVEPVAVQPLPPVGAKLAVAEPPAPPVAPPVAAAPVVQTVAYVTPAPEAAPSGPSVALSRRVVESAAAFVGYMHRASALKPQWVDAPGVAHAVEAGGIYEQGELQEGEVAYAALVALQDPRFVAVLRGASVDPMAREALGRALLADPGVVLQTPGARGAAVRAASALGRLGYGLDLSGAAVKHSAYDMQHAAWSLTNVAEPQAALLRLKARSAVREPLGDDAGRTLIASLSGAAAADGEVNRVTPVVAKGLTLAALAVLGEAGEDRGATLLPILADAANAQCVKMARLNLYQCLSVAGPQYEDVFCLGEHAMMETARCVEAASGWTPTPVAAPPPSVELAAMQAPAPPPATSIYVPVAMTAAPAPAYAVASAEMGGQR